MKKTIVVLSILFCVIAFPALGELTDADLDKIRLIVKEEVKEEITASEKRTREYIDLKIGASDQKIDDLDKSLNGKIDDLDKSLNGKVDDLGKSLNSKVDDLGKSLNGRMDDIRTIMIALIALVTAAIAVPQIIMAYKERGQKDMQTQQREMQTQIDELRKELETMQNTPS